MNSVPNAADNIDMTKMLTARFAIVTALLLASHLPGTRSFAATSEPLPGLSGEAQGHSNLSILFVPILRATLLPSHREDHTESSGAGAGVALERSKGWTVAGFPLGQTSYGVYVEVHGRSELGRVELLYDDGSLDRVEPVNGHVYGAGIYELARFDTARHVVLVRMKARAATALARIKILVAPEPI